MGSYQYYEFLAVDRPLNEGELAKLRSISTRAEITPTSFCNEYHYGDLKADPVQLLERYFDVHVQVSSWGLNQLVLRLPADVLTADELASYCVDEWFEVRAVGKHTVLDLRSEIEDVDWADGSGWMGSLAGVRTELMRGDRRALYLGWLLGVNDWEPDLDQEEPPVPPGLGTLSASLAALAEFLRLDGYLVAAAAEASAPEPRAPRGLPKWIAQLSEAEKNSLLLRVAQGEHASVAAALVRRCREETKPKGRGRTPERRTMADLLARADALRDAERRREAQAKAEAQRQREAEAAAAQAKRLDALAARKPKAWRDVQQLVDSKKPKSYDQAVATLKDLRALAKREGDEPAFERRLRELRALHARKPSFTTRLDEANLS